MTPKEADETAAGVSYDRRSGPVLAIARRTSR